MNILSAGSRTGETVPIFPLSTVLFPGSRLPLRIFEQRYMDMAKACLKHDSPFGVCLIREGAEVGTPAVPEAVGCLARLAEWDMDTVGILKVTAEGLADNRGSPVRRHQRSLPSTVGVSCPGQRSHLVAPTRPPRSSGVDRRPARTRRRGGRYTNRSDHSRR